MIAEFPSYIQKYFWGDDLADLSFDRHSQYVCERIFEYGDFKAMEWLIDQLGKEQVIHYLKHARISQRSGNFWALRLAVNPKELKCFQTSYQSQQHASWKK